MTRVFRMTANGMRSTFHPNSPLKRRPPPDLGPFGVLHRRFDPACHTRVGSRLQN
jgi:hypothetical protein